MLKGIVAHRIDGTNGTHIKDLKLDIVRLVWRWKDIEKSKGQPNYSDCDKQLERAEALGLKVLVNLGHPPAWAVNSGSGESAVPYLADWSTHARDMANRYAGRVYAWGCHNEPNLERFWSGTPEQYRDLLIHFSKAVRAEDPKAKVVAGELAMLSSGEWPEWLDLMAAHANLYDVLAIHAYHGTTNELISRFTVGQWPFLQSWFPKFRPYNQYLLKAGKPIWLTETGFRSDESGERHQADQFRSLNAWLPTSGVEACMVYELRDDANISKKWGLMANDYRKKPAFDVWAKTAVVVPPVDPVDPVDQPVDPPATPDPRWTVKQRSKLGKETKGSGLLIHPVDGRVIELVYDNKSRRDTYLRVNGRQIAHIGGETANAFVTPDGRTWISVEMGTSGEPAELVGSKLRGLGWQGHYMGCGVALDGKPYFLDLKKSADAKPTVRNEAGKVVLTLAGRGIPYDVAVLPSGVYAVSLCDGFNTGISWSTGEHIKCDARGLIVRSGSLLAGIKGELIAVTPRGMDIKLTGKLGDSIDSLAMDPDGNLWISASNPDSLYVLLPDNTVVRVASFKDASDGGALFRSRVACGAGRIIWGINRRADNHWETYNVVRA